MLQPSDTPLKSIEAVQLKPTSIVQCLQHDILSEIFLIVAHSALLPLPDGEPRSAYFNNAGSLDVNDTIFLEPDPDQQPWTLRHICRHWRQVALDTPRLWSHIKFELGFNAESYHGHIPIKQQLKHFYMALQWLNLSKHAPLTICLRLNEESFFPALPWHFLESMERLEYLCILRGSCIAMRSTAAIQAVLTKAKNLKGLELRDTFLIQGAFYLDKHPSLKHLHLHQEIVLPSSHDLESFSGECSLDRLQTIMESFPRLSTIDISLNTTLPNYPDSNPQLASPLRVLKLPYSSIRATRGFLLLLNSPPIHQFELTVRSDRDPFTVGPQDDVTSEYEGFLASPLSAFIQRISSTLTTLKLGMAVDDTVILPLLSLAPNVERLTIIVFRLTQQGIHNLAWDGPNTLCPNLTRLGIYTKKPSHSHLPADPLVRMLRSRLDHNSSLKVELDLTCDRMDILAYHSCEELMELSEQPSLNLVLSLVGSG